MNLLPALQTWLEHGREALRTAILSSNLSPQDGEAIYHWLVNSSNLEDIVKVHETSRKRARGRAASSIG
jgi:predicted HAD superfamily phosphohydrolase